MKTSLRFTVCLLALALLLSLSAYAGGACCSHGKCSKSCGQFKAAEAVDWQNRGVAFGNYMKFDKPEIPAPAPPAPVQRQAPKFDPIYFDLDKAVLKPEGAAVADKVVADLKANPGDTVLIEGNCCDLGTTAYNMALGQRRADAVKKYLVEHGIDSARITTKSNGKEKPVAGKDHRELNRRADCIVSIVPAVK